MNEDVPGQGFIGALFYGSYMYPDRARNFSDINTIPLLADTTSSRSGFAELNHTRLTQMRLMLSQELSERGIDYAPLDVKPTTLDRLQATFDTLSYKLTGGRVVFLGAPDPNLSSFIQVAFEMTATPIEDLYIQPTRPLAPYTIPEYSMRPLITQDE
jgi:hypothetical protein